MGERRESKKRETRERISDVATALFFERGFEAVTVEEIAVAAGVSKMTVFNYFARKEELLLDREELLLLLPFREALRGRKRNQSPIQLLRETVEGMHRAGHPFALIAEGSPAWWKVVRASPSLKARLHELEDEAAQGLAAALGGESPSGVERLMAGMIVVSVRTAREEAVRALESGASVKKANAAFLKLLEQGLSAAEAAGTKPPSR